MHYGTPNASSTFRGLRAGLLALALYGLGQTPALASFAGQSIYSFKLFNSSSSYDSRRYTDLDALCADAVASYTQATGHTYVLKDIVSNGDLPACSVEYQDIRVSSQWYPGSIFYRAIDFICPANSYAIVSVYEKTTCFCNAFYIQSNNTCVPQKKPVVIGFFNGVWNTENDAHDGRKALEALIGSQYPSQDLRYETFYNQTGSANGNTGLQDVAEVFIQRSQELDGVLANRLEHFWDLLAGRQSPEGDSLTARLLNGLDNDAAALSQLLGATFNDLLGNMAGFYSKMLSSPPTAADEAAHLQILQSLADQGYSFVLIAHSQGNLFVNAAYDALRNTRPNAVAEVVHIAPASPTLRGDYVLADIDRVINALRIQGSDSVPDVNIHLPDSTSDLTGHTLVGTYLDATRAARGRINILILEALGAL